MTSCRSSFACLADVYPSAQCGNHGCSTSHFGKIRYRRPRSETRIDCEPTDFEQPDRAVPVWTHRLEQLDHLRVVDGVPEQTPADDLREVIVTHRQRVGVTERPLRRL